MIFQIRLFQIRLFQIRLFQIRLFQIKLSQVRLSPILFLIPIVLPLALIIIFHPIFKNPHFKTSIKIPRGYSRVNHSYFQVNAYSIKHHLVGLLIDQHYQVFDFEPNSKLPLIYLKIDYFAKLPLNF